MSKQTTHNDIIVGLGGHIDHGKTTLIKALNGFDGDTLKEEKRRGITLDLSFSHLCLESRNIAFIDVPGHSKLVKNMIAGAFGIDILLLVVAANEGIMPQTLEHIQIADYLGITQCLCVITKIDKVEDQKTITQLKKRIEELFTHYDINLYHTLALSLLHQQDSHKELAILKNLLHSIPKPSRTDLGLFLYYVDRSFSIKGAGCVVTGSVMSGQCAVGDKLFAYHSGKEVGIRSIEIHDQISTQATPSHRVALNLTQISHTEIARGELLSHKGYLRGFDSIDVGIFGEAQHNASYQLSLGSDRLSVKLCILGQVQNNHSFGKNPLTFATLKCERPVFGVYSQRFILKGEHSTKQDRDSKIPTHTSNVLGGVILNPISDPIKKHTRIQLLQALACKDFPTSFTLLTQIHKRGFGLVSSTQRFALSHHQALEIAHKLHGVFLDQKALTLYPESSIESLKLQIIEIVTRNTHALLSAQSLHFRAKWASIDLCQKALDELLEEGQLSQKQGLYLSKHCKIEDIKAYVQKEIYSHLKMQHFSPSAPYNLYDELEIDKYAGDEALKSLCAAKKVVRLTHNCFITTQALNEMNAIMRECITKHGYVDIATLRTYTDLSRKYLIAYLEYLDKFDDIICTDNKRGFKYCQG